MPAPAGDADSDRRLTAELTLVGNMIQVSAQTIARVIDEGNATDRAALAYLARERMEVILSEMQNETNATRRQELQEQAAALALVANRAQPSGPSNARIIAYVAIGAAVVGGAVFFAMRSSKRSNPTRRRRRRARK